MMGDRRTFRVGRFRGANVHTAIDLARIRGNDLAAQFCGECDAERGLSACGGADDGDEAGLLDHYLIIMHNLIFLRGCGMWV